MKKTGIAIAVMLATYVALYAVARVTKVLVMYDGYRGAKGVEVAELGPAPEETIIVCAVARVLFWPMMQAETFVRKR